MKLRISENQYNKLVREDEGGDYTFKIMSLIKSGIVANIELAIQLSIGQNIDISQLQAGAYFIHTDKGQTLKFVKN